jgi:ABC-type multidrug transport system fused ATPase/permease subunit
LNSFTASISQDYIQQTTKDLIAARAATIIVIAHRQADFIAVLEKGTIRKIGAHSELAHHGGLYQRLKDLELRGLLDCWRNRVRGRGKV